jgi:23S rRNA (uridine2552-2'-O)-methyltransferase
MSKRNKSKQSKNQSKSSKAWLKEHFEDHYVLEAKKLGYRSRACFKLIEIQEKDRLVKEGMYVLDLGAAPGGWSQLAVQWVGNEGKVIASDILPMDYLPGVDFIQGDFNSDEVYEQLCESLEGQKIDLVISDMAPNISGNAVVDQYQAMNLCELALAFAEAHLKPEGSFLIKVFQGKGQQEFEQLLKKSFSKVLIRKPKSSRARSKEVYYLAHGLSV